MDKPSVNEQLRDSAISHGVSLNRVSKHICNDVISDLVQLRDELTGKLNTGAVQTDWARNRDKDLLQFASATIDRSYADIAKKTTKSLDGLGAIEIHKLSTTVNTAVGVELSAAMSENQLAAISQTDKLLVAGATTGEWFKKQSSDFIHTFSTETKMSMLKGESISSLVKTTKDLIDGQTTARATALARSATAVVQSSAQKKYFDSNVDIIKGLAWCATICRRTCLRCAALDGLAWAYPSLDPIGHSVKFPGWAPLHWGCRCCGVPALRSWAELANVKIKAQDDKKVDEIFRQKLRDKGWSEERIATAQRNQRASVDGQIPQSISYEKWLKSRPVEMQQQILGPARHQLWESGKVSIDAMTDGDGSPLSVAELHAAVKANVAVPPSRQPVAGDAGLSLGERQILGAMRTAAVQEDAYKSAWLSGKGIVVDQSTTHTLKAEEFAQLKDEPDLVHLSNSRARNEFWDSEELNLWAALDGFQAAKMVQPSGAVVTVRLKSGQQWTAADIAVYLKALGTAKQNPRKYRSVQSQVAYAFRATGRVTFAATPIGEIQSSAKLFRMVYPAMVEQPASFAVKES